jgi:hypothetical protein
MSGDGVKLVLRNGETEDSDALFADAKNLAFGSLSDWTPVQRNALTPAFA